MSDSGGRFKFLKKFSSKIDKLFLGDMVESNKSSYNESFNSQEHLDNKQDIVGDYLNNSFDERKVESKFSRDFDNNPKENFRNISNTNSDNFEDKYSNYIYVDEFEDFNRNPNFQNEFQNEFRDNLRYDRNYPDVDNYYDSYYVDDSFANKNLLNHNLENNNLESNSEIDSSFLSLFNLKNLKNKLINSNDSSKKNFGIMAICLIILVLGASLFYFGFYQPFQNELNTEKTAKLNELNALYKGPLALNSHVYTLENQIEDSYNIEELKSIDVLRIATEDWRDYHVSKINAFEDPYGRIMMSYSENDSKKVLMPVEDAKLFVNENDAKILSNIAFGKVDTVIVPIYITRLQATGGLISVGSIVDIYSLSSNTTDYSSNSEDNDNSNNGDSDNSDNGDGSDNVNGDINDNNDFASSSDSKTIGEEPDVSGATVLAILRSKDSGVVDSSFSKSTNLIKGNTTYPTEHSSSFSTDAEELLKSSIFKGHNNNALSSYLDSYGIKLSDYERLSNIGELDTDYLVLLEVPRSDVDFVINNMENLILTIPTEYAPNWAINELNETYYRELDGENNYF